MSKTTDTAPSAPKTLPAMLASFRKARIVGTPILGISTFDDAATINSVKKMYEAERVPMIEWDVTRGVQPVNDTGKSAVASLGGAGVALGSLPELLMLEPSIPEDTIVFVHNSHLFMESAMVRQGIWNTRDAFKANGRIMVLLAPQNVLPAELQNDVLLLDEALPTSAELSALVVNNYNNNRAETPEMPELTPEMIERAVDALAGLSHYPAETALNLSLTRAGINFSDLWERKRRMVEQTPGLTIYRGAERFEDVAGLSNVKKFISLLVGGHRKPRAVIWLDEIEKMFGGLGAGGAGGDSSGTTQDQLGHLLGWMQDKNVRGMLFVGFPGSGKSLIAKVTGAECGVPTIQMDLGSMKGSLVGQSEERIRQATKVADAVGQDNLLVIATCNSIANLPPEFRRRFKYGTYFFDLPNAEERQATWELYAQKHRYNGNIGGINFDEGWTGAEIQTCVELASELEIPLQDAASYLVPVCRSMSSQVEAMRASATGRYISASAPGIYDVDAAKRETLPRSSRKNSKLED